MSFIYIASPYTHEDPDVRHARFTQAMAYTAWMLSRGFHVYSPIVHCHELANKFDLPKDFPFWKSYNAAMLSKASRLDVLTVVGWKESKGVKYEIDLANELCTPVTFALQNDLTEAFSFAQQCLEN